MVLIGFWSRSSLSNKSMPNRLKLSFTTLKLPGALSYGHHQYEPQCKGLMGGECYSRGWKVIHSFIINRFLFQLYKGVYSHDWFLSILEHRTLIPSFVIGLHYVQVQYWSRTLSSSTELFFTKLALLPVYLHPLISSCTYIEVLNYCCSSWELDRI